MASIQINDLRPVGSELFNDSESFLQEILAEDINEILGGFYIHIARTSFCVGW